MIQIEPINDKQRLVIAYSTFLALLTFFCCCLLISSNEPNKLEDSQQVGDKNVAFVQRSGSVQGASTKAAPTILPPTSAAVNKNLPAKYSVTLKDSYKLNSQIVLQGRLPADCLNKDGYFCKGYIFSANSNTPLESITLTPDSYNSWKFPVSKISYSGAYQLSIFDSAGSNKIQDILFEVK